MKHEKTEALDLDDIIDGLIACAYNSRKCADDAWRLYRYHRYHTAGLMAILSLEELGKWVLLTTAADDLRTMGQVDWRTFWKRWYSHEKKSELTQILTMFSDTDSVFVGYIHENG